MDKLIRYLQNYLIYGFLFLGILILWQLLQYHYDFASEGFPRHLYNILSFNFPLWFLALMVYLLLLVFVPSVRDKKLRRLANLQERDEREAYIAGKAARTAYMATFSLLLVTFIFSLLNLFVMHAPSPKTGKPVYTFGLGIHYQVFSKPQLKTHNNTDLEKFILFDSHNYALSNSTLILFLLVWQVVAFNLTTRKERKI